MFQGQSPLEALDGRAKVAEFNVNLGFFDVDFRDRLVVEQNFVKLHQGRVQVLAFERLLGSSQLLKDLVFLYLIEVKFSLASGHRGFVTVTQFSSDLQSVGS